MSRYSVATMLGFLWTMALTACEPGLIGAPDGGPLCRTASDCDDHDICTDDSCDPERGCQHAFNSAPCDDGQACSQNDHCQEGRCVGAPVENCDDGNACTTDTCQDGVGCVHLPNTAACDDGDACTTSDACTQGACRGGPALSCDDGNGCTDDACDPASGCTHAFNTAPCDDGDACTGSDACAQGSCRGGPALACDDGNACTDDACDPASGCTHAFNTAPCDDGDACTGSDACAQGSCRGGPAPSCDDGNGCTHDACDPASGCLHTNACDPHATCQAGTCVCLPGYSGDGFTCVSPCGDGECGAGETLASCPQDCDFTLVVVLESSLESGLASQFEQYRQDVSAAGRRVYAVTFPGGTAADLRTFLAQQVTERGVEGAWLVGNLPAAWYEQTAFSTAEQFPCDVYLLDHTATWTDADADGRFDAHTQISATFFVSRLLGTLSQLQGYFAKLHAYRTAGSLVAPSAFIFKDDDWATYIPGYDWGLDALYLTRHKIEDTAQTTRANYIARMEGDGAEFVYQWIHSSPTTLYIAGTGSGTVNTDQIVAGDHRASFYNLFDCSASRFTETNLGMTYVVRTSRGLATIGSTKTGGIYSPATFHARLAAGDTWGEAFRQWYDSTGRWDDEWYLGIVILGDPLLTIDGDTRGLIADIQVPEPTEEQRQALWESMRRRAADVRLGTFEEYRAAHPEFFDAKYPR
ncbi:MAG: hypothetical protein GYA21_00340 [Myxococcales bacterium]|nr:hypothetical protein [Myxococcales bacterium]